jgi:hypothetical protein
MINFMVFQKIKEKITEFYKKKIERSRHQSFSEIKIGFICGFHGKTGAPVAIANIANGLSRTFTVSFEVEPLSFYHTLLESTVKLETEIGNDKDIYFFDLRADLNVVKQKKALNKIVILTVHGLRPPANNLSDQHIDEMLFLADKVHFVGKVQQHSYQLPADKYFIIPNGVNTVNKTEKTNNIGIVGNLNKPKKNASLSVDVGLKSECEKIHLWSTNKSYSKDNRIVSHTWENDRNIIFNSFDVLVFFSQQETFGLVVAEALSAGIPCVLSDLEAFLPFSECPGVVIVKNNEIHVAHQHINRLLADKEKLRQPIITFYHKHFSLDKNNRLWHLKVLELIEKPIS